MCCGGTPFSVSNREACAILAFCVVFSPVIAVGAIGYGVGKGVVHGVKKTNEALKIASHKHRRRARGVLAKQRNRAVDAVGDSIFQKYLQTAYEKAMASPSFETQAEYAIAIYASDDVLGAEQLMSTVWEMPLDGVNPVRIGQIKYIHGIMLQQLGTYQGASQCFDRAAEILLAAGEDGTAEVRVGPDGVTEVPQVTLADVQNAQGYLRYILAMYAEKTQGGCIMIVTDTESETDNVDLVARRLQLLEESIVYYNMSMKSARTPQGLPLHNRGLSKYYMACAVTPVDKSMLLDAMSDFEAAIAVESYEAVAVSMVMKAQSLFLLGKLAEAIESNIKAHELNPKLFDAFGSFASRNSMVRHIRAENITEEQTDRVAINIGITKEQFLQPWPAPQFNRKAGALHEFLPIQLLYPTWCDGCMNFISLSDAMAQSCYQCKRCRMRVHDDCRQELSSKSCWPEIGERIEVGAIVELNDAAPLHPWERAKVTSEPRNGQVTVQPQYGPPLLVPTSWLKVIEHGTGAVTGHVHRLKNRNLHRPHWCSICQKWIGAFTAYQCSECPIIIHKACVPGNAVLNE
jgi:tetratricopeptide (TPR) repeat protein